MRSEFPLLTLVAATAEAAAALVNRGAVSYENAFPPPPHETVASLNNDGVHGLSPVMTDAPVLPRYGVMARQNTFARGPDTCGYSANGEPWRCYTRDATCVYASPYAGCCRSAEICASLYTTCYPYSDVRKGSCESAFEDVRTGCCYESDKPNCVLNTIDLGDSQLSLWGCSAGTTGAVLVTTNPINQPEISTTSSPAQTDNTGTDSSNTPSSPNEEADAGNDTGGGDRGSSTNVGAIAGGAVGGVAVLALIGAAIFFFRRQKKKDAATSTTSATQMQQQQQPGYGSPPTNNAYGVNNGQPSYNYGAHNQGAYSQQQQQQQQQQGSPGPYSPSTYSSGYGQPQQSWGYPSPTEISTSPVRATTASPGSVGKEPTSTATELPENKPTGSMENRAELG